jgi:oligoribonuclease NrnB/cAMP/cGMP phosphodiesterase (DHH superfamily)
VNINDIHVFTDADLDGAISYLILNWFIGKELPVTVTTEKDISKEIDLFFKSKNVNEFRRVYILDIDICSIAEKVDLNNFSIVDHHMGSIECAHKFVNARTKISDEGSTCKLLYKVLKEHYKKDLNQEQKALVAVGHDYDSYNLKNKELAIGLNTLFWNYQGNRLQKFIKRFGDGFTGFTKEEERIISYYRKKIDNYIKETPVYASQITIGSNKVKVCSIVADFCINEIAQQIIEQTNSEVGIVVNLRSESVSFRRSKTSNINVARLAEKIANGGGHPAAAGGKITPTFVEFTKLL